MARNVFSFVVVLLAVCVARADFARDLAVLHVEAVGGRERVDALRAVKMSGVTRGAGVEIKFTLWAQRPNRIRTEVVSNGRTVVQVWDGKADPWRADSQTKNIQFLSGIVASEFKAQAEYDNPLLAGPDRRVSLDYLGEVEQGGHTWLKLMATQNLTETSFIFLEPTSYLIDRIEAVRRRPGAEYVLRTDYRDWRPVAGVLMPHRLVVWQNGKQVNETVIDKIEPNPPLGPDVFKLPASAGRVK